MIDERDDDAIECSLCSDTGWRISSCDGDGPKVTRCGRRRRHLPHDFATPCECRPINRHYQEKQGSYQRVA